MIPTDDQFACQCISVILDNSYCSSCKRDNYDFCSIFKRIAHVSEQLGVCIQNQIKSLQIKQ